MQKEKRNCPECGEIVIGREDKRFCSDACRNTYNYRSNRQESNLVRSINNRLKKNYKILCEINRNGKARATRDELIRRGFDFSLITYVRQTRHGNFYYYLYDQGYTPIGSERYLLIRKPPQS